MSTDYNENHAVYYSGKYWNDYPECLSIINTRLFGRDVDWKTWLIENDYTGFKHILVLNCGNGWVERELFDAGIIEKATCVEYSASLVEQCETERGSRSLEYVCHDINTVGFEDNTFDMVLNFAACHHVRYIERLCIKIRAWLKPNAPFIHNDYIGPQRNQYSKSQWHAMMSANMRLPFSVRKQLGYPDVTQMMIDDPTEAINSCHIIPTLYALYDVITHTKSGGVVAYELLTHNDKLYNAPSEVRVPQVTALMKTDAEYLKETGDSFFHFLVCNNTKSVSVADSNSMLERMDAREQLTTRMFGHYAYNILEPNELVRCSALGHGQSFFVHGFSAIEPHGRWSNGDTSIIRFRLPDSHNEGDCWRLELRVCPLPSVRQIVTISTHGIESEQVVEKEHTLDVLVNEDPSDPGTCAVMLRYSRIDTPASLGLNGDGRKLALCYTWIQLSLR